MMQSEIAQKIFVEIESEREIEWGKNDPFLQYSVNRMHDFWTHSYNPMFYGQFVNLIIII